MKLILICLVTSLINFGDELSYLKFIVQEHFVLIMVRVNSTMDTVEYFLFDVGHFSLISTNNCFRYYKSCSLRTIIDLIKKMLNIRHVHLIINKYDIEKLLDIDEWKILVYECFQLKKVTLKVWGNMFQDEQLIKKALEI
jgi:hypothetical protein